MGGNHIIHSFSYHIDERAMIKRAEDIAHDMGISFSEYVVRCMKASDPVVGEGGSQKKEVGQGASQGPTNIEGNDTHEFKGKPEVDTNDIYSINQYINSIDDASTLRRLQKNGHVIDTVAKTRLKRLVYS